jgi:hypothetical protein
MATMHQQAEAVERARTVAIAIAALALAIGAAWLVNGGAHHEDARVEHDVLTLPQVDTSRVELFQLR